MAEKYVPIFLDWTEVTEELNDAEKGRLIDAIVTYARGGSWPEVLEGNERYLFPAFRRQIDRQNEISSARAAAGEKGGKQTEAKPSKPKQTQAKPSKSANKYKYEYEYKDNNEYENKNNISADADKHAHTREKFQPPSIAEVKAYCDERKNFVDAEHFVAHYTANGWKVGKNPMKDWKAAVRTWEKTDFERNAVPSNRIGTSPNAERFSPSREQIMRQRALLRELKGDENETENVG